VGGLLYEVGMSREFRAWHVMPGAEGPEGTLHSHQYRLEVVVARVGLDDMGMVVDLDVLEEAVKETVGRIHDRDLEIIRPEGVEAVTVEVLAAWAHEALVHRLGSIGGELAVRVWESPVAFGGYWGSLGRER
jgi:6-pyruvoyltetrahydropterin/6-carboxytetrahydropterin synthase